MTRRMVMTDNKDMSHMFTETAASQEIKRALNDPVNKATSSLGPTGYLAVNSVLTISGEIQFKIAQDKNNLYT